MICSIPSPTENVSDGGSRDSVTGVSDFLFRFLIFLGDFPSRKTGGR